MLRKEYHLLRAPVHGLNDLRGIGRASRARWRAVLTICILLVLFNVVIGFQFEDTTPLLESLIPVNGVVLVRVETDQGVRSGTGFAVSDSTLLTAAHVAGDVGTEVLLSNDSGFTGYGRVVASGYAQYQEFELDDGRAREEGTPHDWALVQFTAESGQLVPLACGSVYTIEQGYNVRLIGHPQGQLTTSQGIVSRKTDQVVYTDAETDKGFSGGPMIWIPSPEDPAKGYVVGVIVGVPIDPNTGDKITSSRKAVSIDHVITQCENVGYGICDVSI